MTTIYSSISSFPFHTLSTHCLPSPSQIIALHLITPYPTAPHRIPLTRRSTDPSIHPFIHQLINRHQKKKKCASEAVNSSVLYAKTKQPTARSSLRVQKIFNGWGVKIWVSFVFILLLHPRSSSSSLPSSSSSSSSSTFSYSFFPSLLLPFHFHLLKYLKQKRKEERRLDKKKILYQQKKKYSVNRR